MEQLYSTFGSHTDNNAWLCKFPLVGYYGDLPKNTGAQPAYCVGEIDLGYPYWREHYGDLDAYGGYLFIPIESNAFRSDARNIPMLGILQDQDPAKNLGSANPYTVQLKQMNEQSDFGWLAINPRDGLLYSSSSNANGLITYLNRYYVKIPQRPELGPVDVYFKDKLYLTGGSPSAPNGVGFYAISGGVFSPNGHLYIVTGDPNVNNGGIYGVDVANGSARPIYIGGSFPYSFKTCSAVGIVGYECDDEPEGIDYLNSYYLAGGPDYTYPGILHALVNNNQGTTGAISFYHYGLQAPDW